jgi:hypothetical protein
MGFVPQLFGSAVTQLFELLEFGHLLGALQPKNSVALVAALTATFIGNRACRAGLAER